MGGKWLGVRVSGDRTAGGRGGGGVFKTHTQIFKFLGNFSFRCHHIYILYLHFTCYRFILTILTILTSNLTVR